MENITRNLLTVQQAVGQRARLVAVSKFHPAEAIQTAYAGGQRIFAESRANELADKAESLPTDIEWHFIGHLQTNKVRRVVKWAHCIQSIDSERLLRMVSDEAVKAGRTIDILLQVHVAAEETKTGFTPSELEQLCQAMDLTNGLPGVRIRGVMGMASNTDDMDRVRTDFQAIRSIFDKLRSSIFTACPSFDTVSMGMSHDFELAIECGSNMVRVGTTIFGEREY